MMGCSTRTTEVAAWVVVLLATTAAFTSNDDNNPSAVASGTSMPCSLNGIVGPDGKCVCDAAWKGDQCEYLNVLPANRTQSGVYGVTPNVTSWGGNIQYSSTDNMYHLFVTEILGKGCGLQQWGTHSSVTHAVSHTVEGPYLKKDTAISNEAHNPQVMVSNNTWYIFHIGTGTNAPAHDCQKKTDIFDDEYDPEIDYNTYKNKDNNGGAVFHYAPSPDGPWKAHTLPMACNNPSPLIARNGSFILVCHNGRSLAQIYVADTPEGTYNPAIHVTADDGSGNGRRWEDPFIWQDARTNYHMIWHTYLPGPWPAMSISGHAYSTNLRNWTWSPVEPYGYVVDYTDGTIGNFSTLERPKLIFDRLNDTMVPVAITNGASSDWDSEAPCTICKELRCSACKVTPGRDWTYTLMRPIAI